MNQRNEKFIRFPSVFLSLSHPVYYSWTRIRLLARSFPSQSHEIRSERERKVSCDSTFEFSERRDRKRSSTLPFSTGLFLIRSSFSPVCPFDIPSTTGPRVYLSWSFAREVSRSLFFNLPPSPSHLLAALPSPPCFLSFPVPLRETKDPRNSLQCYFAIPCQAFGARHFLPFIVLSIPLVFILRGLPSTLFILIPMDRIFIL